MDTAEGPQGIEGISFGVLERAEAEFYVPITPLNKDPNVGANMEEDGLHKSKYEEKNKVDFP